MRSIPAWAGETLAGQVAHSMNKVYPRVGGGNRSSRRQPRCSHGLSPRGRGKQRLRVGEALDAGSIPAWAGETPPRGGIHHRRLVYPRVGGGNVIPRRLKTRAAGLSPRGRGKLFRRARRQHGRGSIPAWAGETPPPRGAGGRSQVYPRVGGGNP